MFAPVFSSMQRLQEQNLVSVVRVQMETQPEGRTRRYLTIRRRGERALALAKETSRVVADFLTDFA